MEHTIRELEVCRWPPPVWLVEEAKVHLAENRDYKLEQYVRLAERAINLFNTVYEALDVIEEAEKNMTSDSYMRLIDSMHRLAMVGERKSELYIEMFHLAQTAANRICTK